MKNLIKMLIPTLFVLGSCGSDDEPSPVGKENLKDPQRGVDAPANSIATTMGPFTSFAHGLMGKAVIYTDAQGIRTLRFENFTMTPGPDVYVLFSKTNNYSQANTIAISILKEGYSNTNLSFEVDKSIDIDTHKFVLVYCVQYSSLFGYSELK